jgi:flagellar biosynthesis component FlhA
MSFFAEIMQPGGGIMLIPFVRVIITILLVLTLMGFVAGIARIHMGILSFLSAGLLFSLSMFEREFNKVNGRQQQQQQQGKSTSMSSASTTQTSNKTD